ncbi:GNAT family N-acetyltransferase [Vibrio sp. HN007]|uniref:GNAT family N-acetyltransferase n=1 Tax=Vibrio iocasae TaxID=3098914 RepID=UPI0035D479F7
MIIAETKRLVIRHFELKDATYILNQLNQDSFIRYIADKNVRTQSDAEKYLEEGPLASYKWHGFGLNMVLLKESGAAIGMCGLVKRDELEHPDLGYACLPEYWSKGYSFEASEAVLRNARKVHGIQTVLGVTHPDNEASNKLLMKLGFQQVKTIDLYGSINNLYKYDSI